LLPWPPSSVSGTVVGAAFDAIAPFCSRMVVVLGHDADSIRRALEPRHFEVTLVDPAAEMIHSVKSGLSAAAVGSQAAGVVLQPADHPAVLTSTVQQVISEFDASGRMFAVMPEWREKGGHPVVIPANLIPSIHDFRIEGGLRQFWQDHPASCRRMPVDDKGVVADLDEPTDYKPFG
jgi:molybdenum cofactor cytidylyltransferase